MPRGPAEKCMLGAHWWRHLTRRLQHRGLRVEDLYYPGNGEKAISQKTLERAKTSNSMTMTMASRLASRLHYSDLDAMLHTWQETPLSIDHLSANQLAYSFYVDLATSKVGLPLDWEHDTIVDILESWKRRFDQGKDLLRAFDVRELENAQAVVETILEILNEHMRPPLTRWQAAYRKWHQESGDQSGTPQAVQRTYPHYDELTKDFESAQSAILPVVSQLKELVFREVA